MEFLDSAAARTLLIAIGSAFVGTCILVALFIVAGTLSLSVQARRREYALLRAVGATPSQVHALIARETLAVAVVAALLGIARGTCCPPHCSRRSWPEESSPATSPSR